MPGHRTDRRADGRARRPGRPGPPGPAGPGRRTDGGCDGAAHRLVAHLDRHVRREEAGIFSALRDTGEFLDEIEALEVEHRTSRPDRRPRSGPRTSRPVTRTARRPRRARRARGPRDLPGLRRHPRRHGWAIVDRAHTESPSFLLDASAKPQQPRKRRTMQKESLTALVRHHLETARTASSGRSAHTVYGGHEHVLRQTLIALRAGATSTSTRTRARRPSRSCTAA